MSKFKNGDRVIGVGYSETLNIDGQRGKVVRVSDVGNILVVFDTKFSDRLHDNGGIGIHQCWWVDNNNCLVLEGEQVDKPPIKEGIVLYRLEQLNPNIRTIIDRPNKVRWVAIVCPFYSNQYIPFIDNFTSFGYQVNWLEHPEHKEWKVVVGYNV